MWPAGVGCWLLLLPRIVLQAPQQRGGWRTVASLFYALLARFSCVCALFCVSHRLSVGRREMNLNAGCCCLLVFLLCGRYGASRNYCRNAAPRPLVFQHLRWHPYCTVDLAYFQPLGGLFWVLLGVPVCGRGKRRFWYHRWSVCCGWLVLCKVD